MARTKRRRSSEMRPQKRWVKVVGWIFAIRIVVGLVGLVLLTGLLWGWLIFTPMEERYWQCMQSSVESAASDPDLPPDYYFDRYFATENRECQGDRPEALSSERAWEEWQQRVLEVRSGG